MLVICMGTTQYSAGLQSPQAYGSSGVLSNNARTNNKAKTSTSTLRKRVQGAVRINKKKDITWPNSLGKSHLRKCRLNWDLKNRSSGERDWIRGRFQANRSYAKDLGLKGGGQFVLVHQKSHGAESRKKMVKKTTYWFCWILVWFSCIASALT